MESTGQSSYSTNFRLWLQSKLIEKCRKNPHYSLRSFAAYLEMDASSVSQIISGKRKASKKVITKICERLSVSPGQFSVFLNEAIKKAEQMPDSSNENYELMAEDAFAYISNWYHYAILELTFIEHFENNLVWIASTLSITVTEAKMAVERLIRLGILTEENGTLKKTNRFITNIPTPGFTTNPQRELQRQILKLALESIDFCPPEERDMTSMTMAIDVEKIPEARKLITKFRRDMCAFLEEGKQARVYHLGIQLYPVSKNHNRSEQ